MRGLIILKKVISKFMSITLGVMICVGMTVPALAQDDGWNKVSEESALEDARKKLITIDKVLNIDCANGNIEALTEYFEKNVNGFDSETFKILFINNSVQDENVYTMMYHQEINGFQTPRSIMVFVENDTIEYISTLDEYNYADIALIPMALSEDTLNAQIEIAKKEAVKEIDGDVTIEGQEVKKILDENLNPILVVKTTCVDAHGGVYLLKYEYNLQ